MLNILNKSCQKWNKKPPIEYNINKGVIKVEWKQITINGEGWPYEVSDSGLVRRIGSTKCLKPSVNKDGYLGVVLSKNGKQKGISVHRLVALMFIPNPENKPEVNHKNENRNDNRAENLEWMTHKNNINYGTRTEKASKSRYKKVMAISLTETKVMVFQSESQAEKLGFGQSCISKCCNGKQKSHKGYKWRYIN